MPAHPDRWDMLLFAGGPVWAMEWCPTPDGAPASQYIALACHQGMDDQHYVNKMYTGPGLVQLWDLGKLEHSTRCSLRADSDILFRSISFGYFAARSTHAFMLIDYITACVIFSLSRL